MSELILNLTGKGATPEQIEAGAINPSSEVKKEIEKLLTFEKLPEEVDILTHARSLSNIAWNWAYDFKWSRYKSLNGISPCGKGDVCHCETCLKQILPDMYVKVWIAGDDYLICELETAIVAGDNIAPVYWSKWGFIFSVKGGL
ncbi:MAG TPA: hypothetical protein ENH28_07535 [Euryarchaeota archaeon]|nr:hypothetical protein [Euryarchaeota archaeon]